MLERAVVRRQVENNHFAFEHPTPMPTIPPPHPPTRKTCHNDSVVSRGEVKGHRHREHILILSGKLGRVQARVPDSKIKTLKKHIEVQVKNKELLQ